MRIGMLVGLSGVLVLGLLGCGKGPRNIETEEKRPQVAQKQAEIPAKDEKAAERKNLIELTERAAVQLRQLMQAMKQPQFLRVRVADGQYKLDLDPDTDARTDLLGESRGVRTVVDRTSAQSMPGGLVVDYLDDGAVKGFKISAPEGSLGPPDRSVSLHQARQGFHTKLARRSKPGTAPPEPPAGVFQLVHYDAPVGKLAAYLSPDPKDGKKHPAIVWITGGDCNTIDQGCWKEGAEGNDQSASAYRKAGMVMMFPSLRGGNDNPGVKEGFFGEVEDVLAALDFLRKQPFVDAERIYLGGHSTGGTLVLLVAEYTDRFRAVFSFGPVDDVLGYGPRYNPFVLSDRQEARLRAPGLWLHGVRSPTFVFEGTVDGNIDSLRTMARTAKNAKVRFVEVKGANHFNLLAPTNRLIAEKILRDTGPRCNLEFTTAEVSKPFAR